MKFTRIWGTGPKDDRKNLKLKVNFVYPEEDASPVEPSPSKVNI